MAIHLLIPCLSLYTFMLNHVFRHVVQPELIIIARYHVERCYMRQPHLQTITAMTAYNQIYALMAGALVATLAAPAAAFQVEWLCERGEDGAARVEIVNSGDQWFQINVEQDGCKRSCEQQVKALGLSPDEENQEIAAFTGTVPTPNIDCVYLSRFRSIRRISGTYRHYQFHDLRCFRLQL